MKESVLHGAVEVGGCLVRDLIIPVQWPALAEQSKVLLHSKARGGETVFLNTVGSLEADSLEAYWRSSNVSTAGKPWS